LISERALRCLRYKHRHAATAPGLFRSARTRSAAGKTVALRLAGGAVALWGLLFLIGVLVTHVLVHGRLQSVDRRADVWFAAHRTGVWNSVTAFGSGMAETQAAIAVTVVVVLLLRWRLGRWYESSVLVVALVGELVVFCSVTATVHRPRPAVVRLDVAPPTASFPSGHTAAAVALCGCIAILVLSVRQVRRRARDPRSAPGHPYRGRRLVLRPRRRRVVTSDPAIAHTSSTTTALACTYTGVPSWFSRS
jgi:membrane-associated phospholipid phosphatase